MMTELELELKKHLPNGHRLGKWNDTADYDADGPIDVYDYLCDMRDEKQREIDDINRIGYTTGRLMSSRELLEKAIEKLNKQIDDVQDADDTYYDIFVRDVKPLKTRLGTIVKPFINKDNELEWIPTGDTVKCYEFHNRYAPSYPYLIPEVQEIGGVHICTETYWVNNSSYYILELVRDMAGYRSVLCPECGTVWTRSEQDVRWFKNKGMTPPKRCHVCRTARRTAREIEQRLEEEV